jgi:hypothetical protein
VTPPTDTPADYPATTPAWVPVQTPAGPPAEAQTAALPGYPTQVLDASPETLTSPPPPDGAGPRPRRRRAKRILLWTLIPLGVVLLAAVGVGGFYLWSQTQFSVLERNGGVAVQQGVGPFVRYEETDVDLALLPTTTRTELTAHVPVDGRPGSAAEIAKLREQVATCKATLVAPCPVRPLKATSVQVSTEGYPDRDHVQIAWKQVDGRGGVVVRLRVNGKRPPRPCPEKLTQAGNCVFDGDFDKEYRVTAVTSGPKGTKKVVSESSAITEVGPHLSAKKGKKFKGKASDTGLPGSFCQVVIRVEGLASGKTYKPVVFTSGHKPYRKGWFRTDSWGAFRGVIYSYGDPTRDSWVQVEVAGLKTKRLNWECGGLY